MNTIEEYKPVVGLEGRYEVSSFGNVKSVDRTIERIASNGFPELWNYKGHPVKGSYVNNPNGYRVLKYRDGKKTLSSPSFHVMVWEAFKGDHDGMDIDHIDGDKSNNRLDNLRLLTRSENMIAHFKRVNKRGNVYINGNKYSASINHKGKKHYLGSYNTEFDARESIRVFDELFNKEL